MLRTVYVLPGKGPELVELPPTTTAEDLLKKYPGSDPHRYPIGCVALDGHVVPDSAPNTTIGNTKVIILSTKPKGNPGFPI